MKRRGLVAATCCVALVGCSGRRNRFWIPQIDVRNRRSSELQITVRICSDETTVFERTDQFSAAVYEEGDDPVEIDGRRWAVEEEVDLPVSVGYRVDGGDWQTSSVERDPDECLIPIVEVEPDEAGVSYAYTCRLPGDTPQ